jgi:hypothetical protein
MYQGEAAQALKDPNPRETLLRALQEGSLKAIRDAKELPSEAWANATGRKWGDDIRFRRDDVLRRWPVPITGHQDESRAGSAFDEAGRPDREVGPGKRQFEKWRTDRIERFKAKQRRERQWISFAEIAEWCSKEDGSILPNKEKSAAAYDTLANDLLAGEFDEKDRSHILFLYPAVKKCQNDSGMVTRGDRPQLWWRSRPVRLSGAMLVASAPI